MTTQRLIEINLPTDWGDFRMVAYGDNPENRMPHIAFVHPELDTSKPVFVRFHSECLTGDLFHSKRCDCGAQFQRAMEIISAEKGILIYLRQEGRGIGIINKMKAYLKQDEGLDTAKANEALGLKVDSREYQIGLQILEDFHVEMVNLLTNNPKKIAAFDDTSIVMMERIPLIIPPNEVNQAYLNTKRDFMGHLLNTL